MGRFAKQRNRCIILSGRFAFNDIAACKWSVDVRLMFDWPILSISLNLIFIYVLRKEPKVLRHNTLQMVASLMACGIDPTKSNIFAQSSVPQHAELCWIFTCLTTMARLSHLPQYKEKSAGMKDIPTGLFIYPILQAADILVHKWVLLILFFICFVISNCPFFFSVQSNSHPMRWGSNATITIGAVYVQ